MSLGDSSLLVAITSIAKPKGVVAVAEALTVDGLKTLIVSQNPLISSDRATLQVNEVKWEF